MKYLLFIAALFTFSGNICGQVSREYIRQLSDSIWQDNRIVGDEQRAVAKSRELLRIAVKQNSYRAKVTAYQVLGRSFYNEQNMDSALWYLQKALIAATAEEANRETAYITQSIGVVYGKKNDYQNALLNFNRSMELWINLKDTTRIIFAYFKRAILNSDADKNVLAMEDYLAIVKLATAIHDSIDIGYAFNGMGILHKKQGNYSLSRKNYSLAIEIFNAINEAYGAAITELNLALVYKSEGNNEEAHSIFNRLYTYFFDENIEEGQMACLANMSVCSNRMNRFRQALQEAENAVPIARRIHAQEAEADIHNEMAKAYLGLNKADSALVYAKLSEGLLIGQLTLEKNMETEKTLSAAYQANNQWELALKHYKRYDLFSDSIFQKEKSKQILELQTKYEADQKQNQIDLLESNATLQKYQRKVLIFGFTGLLLLSIFIIIRGIKRRQKDRRLYLAEQHLANTKQERLKDQLEFKKRELTSQALHLSQKQKMIHDLRDTISTNLKDENQDLAKPLMHVLNFDSHIDEQWDQFMQTFQESDPDFYNLLLEKYPNLSKTDLRISALIKMNLNNKEMANILNISDEGIKKARYRLRKKLGLDNADNLDAFLLKSI